MFSLFSSKKEEPQNNSININNISSVKKEADLQEKINAKEESIVINKHRESMPISVVNGTFSIDMIQYDYIDSGKALNNKMRSQLLTEEQKASLFKQLAADGKTLDLIHSDDVTSKIIYGLQAIDNYFDRDNRDHSNDKNDISSSFAKLMSSCINDVYDPAQIDPIIKAIKKNKEAMQEAIKQNNGFPVKNRALKNFEEVQSNKPKDKHSHPIIKVTKVTGGGGKQYILKGTDPEMAFLEVISNRHFCRLAPDVMSSSNAVYNNHEYTGVAAKIRKFVSFREKFYSAAITDEQIKKLAQMLVGSYLLKEDDLHRGNIGEEERVDCDMLFWPILRKKKGDRGQDYIPGYRRDVPGAFKITADDIHNFPDIGDNYCHFWVTKTGLGDNNFSSEQNDFFKKLKTNPVFIREKFRMMLKFLLVMNVESSRAICRLHAPENAAIDGELVQNLFATEIKERKRELRDVLVGMPEFHDFMAEHGDVALEEIIAEVEVANEKIAHKKASDKPGYEPLHVNIANLRKEYAIIRGQADSLGCFVVNDISDEDGQANNGECSFSKSYP